MCRAPLPSVTGLEGRGGMCVFANVCALFKLSDCVLMNYCTCVLFLFILFTFSREAAGRSLQCVRSSDRPFPEATAAAKYHTPGCTACAAPAHSVSSKTLLPC